MARRINTSSGASSSIDRHVVSPSLLKSIDSEIQRPSRPEFLLGLGEPFEPNPWDLDCPEDDDAMLQASQVDPLKPLKSNSGAQALQLVDGALPKVLFDCRKSERATSQETD